MTDNMIERIAIAIFVAEIGGEGWPRELPDKAKEHFRAKARAAIEAMREPTPEMVQAGKKADWVGKGEGRAGWSIVPYKEHKQYHYEDETCEACDSPGIWPAMIDAALKPV